MIRYTRFATPLGALLALAEDGFITRLDFVDAKYAPAVDAEWEEAPADRALADCARQLGSYFDGSRRDFDLPLAPRGTEFQRRVWREIAGVAYGETITYAELARRAGAPGAARAAGAATGRNPIGIVVPCHRIVRGGGGLAGYAGGLARKTRLLEIEGVLQGALV